MRLLTLLAVAVSLSACGPAHDRAVACRQEVGWEPGAGLAVLSVVPVVGLVAALANEATPEYQDWKARRDACLERRRLAQEGRTS